MQPAVEPGDTLFVSKFAYGFRLPWNSSRLKAKNPNYGDVVVLEFPEELGRDYIKRVLALPGDTVSIEKGALILNGRKQTDIRNLNDLCATETLPSHTSYTVCFDPPILTTEKTITVPANQVFVAGDLRSMPADGRRLRAAGLVPYSSLRGRAEFVWLSIQSPGNPNTGGDWFSRIRFNRIFKKIQ